MKENVVLTLPEALDRNWIVSSGFLRITCKMLVLDFVHTKLIDTSALCALRLMHRIYTTRGSRLILRNISPSLLSLLQHAPVPKPLLQRNTHSGYLFFARIGEMVISAKEQMLHALSVAAEMLYWGTIGSLKRQDFRKGCLGEQMFLLGYKALGIVALLSFLVGTILALQASMQLKAYGAGVFLGPLIGILMIREMGPLLTAVILAGRTGSATTAEIGTMSVSEELDALKTMAINPIQFVVVPKFWAITVTMPVLSIVATVAGILGGFCIAVFYLDLSSSIYWGELSKNLFFKDIMAGFIKSVVFSWLIIWIGAYFGFKVRGGAESVGRETTASVVACIFIIIIADALFSFIL